MTPLTLETESWHASETASVLHQLATDPASGLGDQEAAARLAQFGANELQAFRPISP